MFIKSYFISWKDFVFRQASGLRPVQFNASNKTITSQVTGKHTAEKHMISVVSENSAVICTVVGVFLAHHLYDHVSVFIPFHTHCNNLLTA